MQNDSLFLDLARGNAEWIVQGLFMHAMQTEGNLLSFLSQKLNETLTLENISDIEEESPSDRSGWRSDVRLELKSGRTIRFELKLTAYLTNNQEKAMQNREMDVLILPSHRKGEITGPLVLSWLEVAECCKDGCLSRLLKEADSYTRWYCKDEISSEETIADLTAFSRDGLSRNQSSIGRFLNALDLALLDSWGDDVPYISGHWSCSRPEKYFGYGFLWKGRKYWIGFHYPNGPDQYKVQIWTWGEKLIKSFDMGSPMNAKELAKMVRKHFGS